MLEKRITRLEEAAPHPRRDGRDQQVVTMLNRLAALKWASGARGLTPDEQHEYDGLWAALGAGSC